MDAFDIDGELMVGRLGFGAMRVTGEDIIGEPDDPEAARDVLRRAADTSYPVHTGCGHRPAKLFGTTAGM
jgi:hypothetical protein